MEAIRVRPYLPRFVVNREVRVAIEVVVEIKRLELVDKLVRVTGGVQLTSSTHIVPSPVEVMCLSHL